MMLDWLKSRIPKREDIEHNRFLRPFAHHLANPNLWRFNRRSVPRGVAVGLFCGILIPVAHTPVAVLAAVPARCNAIVAAAVTWLVNPLTIGPLLYAAHWIGKHVVKPVSGGAIPAGRISWLHSGMSLAGTTMVGLLPIAIAAAVLGYGIALGAWRFRTARKWARRRAA